MMLCLPTIYTVDGDMSWRPLNSFCVVEVSDDSMFSVVWLLMVCFLR